MKRLVPAHFERIAIEPASSLQLSLNRGRGYPFHLHYHPEIELTLIVKGHGMRFVGDSVQPFQEGDLCLIGSNLLHTWSTGEEPMATEATVIQFDPEKLLRAAGEWPEMRLLAHLPERCCRGLQLVGTTRRRIAQQMKRALASPANSAARLLGLFEMAELICRAPDCDLRLLSSSPTPATQMHPSLKKFQGIVDRLHEQMPEAPDQASMAAAAGMTPSAFSRFFRRLAGRSYVEYVNAWRIGLACRRLLQTDDPVIQIAFDCGFENLSNFNRRFQQFKQMTPTRYRRLARH